MVPARNGSGVVGPQPAVPGDEHGVNLRMETLISWVLETGVVVSMTLIVLGTVLMYVHHPDYVRSREALPKLIAPNQAEFPHSVVDVFRHLGELQGRSVVILGLFLLIATPVLRVLVSILVFVLTRDWIFAGITMIVLCFLIVSFLLGQRH